ncbi:MAG: C-terminal binding protein [Chloroflexota bacterium]
MTKFKVLVTDYAWPTLDIERDILAQVGAELVVAKTGEADELIRLASDVDAILTCWKQVPSQALENAPRCQIVSRYGIGLDNIPIAQATTLGMLVTNVPDFCLEEVSDQVMAYILAFARRVITFTQETRQGQWGLQSGQGMPRLRGQTLGLIGYGNIAQTLVPKARAFGLNVIAYTPRLAPDALGDEGTATNSLALVLRQADYISIHAPLTDETHHLINAQTLRLMKPTAFLINTARGAIINEADLHQALTEGWIAGAGLDVLTEEPATPNHPLLGLDNVIITPHSAFYSEAAIAELQQKAAHNVAQVLSGKLPTSIINPEVLDQANFRGRIET